MGPVVTPEQTSAAPACILLVDDEPAMLEVMADLALRDVSCKVLRASSLSEARNILETQPVELMIADIHLPDGDGTSLLELLKLHHPSASAMIMTGMPTVETAVDAIRHGAVDFIPKPFTQAHIAERVKRALDRQAKEARREKRMDRLKVAVKRLSEARRLISKKVDLLCNDLVSAYGELSKQFDGVRFQEGFRKYIQQATDLEQLLCHSMDWMMRQLGYSNVAVWLAAEDGEFQLGAYMKYTVAGSQELTDLLKRVILPVTVREGMLHVRVQDVAAKMTPHEAQLLRGHDLLAVNCTYLGESLATVIFFRDARSPFSADDEALLKIISPMFAIALASMVRGKSESSDEDGPFLSADGSGDTMEDDHDKPRRDAADWWKTGEAPPF